MARYFARNGAVVMGRTMFDHGEEPWGPNPPFRCASRLARWSSIARSNAWVTSGALVFMSI